MPGVAYLRDPITLSDEAGAKKRSRVTQEDRVIGKRIRFRRLELGMTQVHVAKAIGVEYQQLEKHERGANRIGAVRLFQIAEALDTPIEYFFQDLRSDRPEGASDIVYSALEMDLGVELLTELGRLPLDVRRRILDLAKSVHTNLPTAGRPRS